MKIPPVKGTRDFYPRQMAVRNGIIDGWKRASIRNGFEEYDGPIFEHLQMYQIKSGDEIVEQLFSLEDRGGRALAIRPEITPTLARMVNQRINSLSRPIKWFSVPRLCRAERPQKGRLREFFQWNIDIIGVEDVLADAEVIFTTVDYLREAGLTDKQVKVKFSSRKLLGALLEEIGIAAEKFDGLYALLDKKAKLAEDVFEKSLEDLVRDKVKAGRILEFMTPSKPFNQMVGALVRRTDGAVAKAALELDELLRHLELMGIGDYCQFDPSIVRGLAYYTGIVFEVHDVVGELRAICGGGRYDNLLRDFGGPSIAATGMGMGDCVLEILLSENGLLDRQISGAGLDYFVAFVPGLKFDGPQDIASTSEGQAVRLAARLRELGRSADFSYKAVGVGKQLKRASERNARKCIIIGDELRDGRLAVKDMSSGEQRLVDMEEFLSQLKAS